MDDQELTKPSRLWEAEEDKRQLPRSLMGGTAAMRESGREYLYQDEGETDAAYEARLVRTHLYNGFRKTVQSHVGRVFDRPVQVKGPPVLVDEWVPNITNDGRNLTIFAKGLMTRVLSEGLSFIHVEYPSMPADRTLRDERVMKARPYLLEIKPENLFQWTWVVEGGIPIVTLVRIREEVYSESAGPVVQIRELTRGNWRLYRRTAGPDESSWSVVGEGSTAPIQDIPVIPVYAERLGVYQSDPPLEDLADLNLAHWQSYSDQRHILHTARVPILFGAGLEDDMAKLVIGPNRLVKTAKPNATLQYVEHTGAAIEAGRKDLEDIEMRMARMGLELLIPHRPGEVTATERAINKAESESDLQIMARSLQDALKRALEMMLKWQGIVGEVEVDVNSSFQLKIADTSELAELRELRMAGELTRRTLWNEFKRRGVLSDDFDPDEEEGTLDTEGPPKGKPGSVEPVVTFAPGGAAGAR